MQDDTRERILNAAEALFAEHGFANTSLRTITTRARVNLAAVNYHFGSKEALIQAVFARRLVPLNDERLKRLTTLENADGEPALEAILEAFIGPTLKSNREADPGEIRFIRLLGRTHAGASRALREFVHSLYAEVLARFEAILSQTLPHIPKDELHWRLHFLMGAMSYTMAGSAAVKLVADVELPDIEDNQAMLRRLIPFLAAGLRAPVSGSTTKSDGTDAQCCLPEL